MPESVIQAISIHKSFKEVRAVQGVDLDVKRGEFVALLGPNGAGKTTLVEMIEGIQAPNEGEILIMGKQWKHHKKELNKILGISLQETRFVEKLTVLETLKLFASLYKQSTRRVHEIIDLVNLSEKKKSWVVNLSGGQRQRLALGISLINKPQILLLDEPTTGLDPTARREIWNILLTLREQEQTSMILTTHYMEEAEILCNRIIIMDNGKILAEGTLEQLLLMHNCNEVIEFSIAEGSPILSKEDLNDTIHFNWNETERKTILHVKSIILYLPKLLAIIQVKGIQINSLICRRSTLDDLFISLTGRRLIN